jgi:hypothetical protein
MTMPRTQTDDLLTRLENLERQNRWLKRLGVALLVLAGTGLLAAAKDRPQKKTVEANRLSLCDDDGNERGYLAATPEGLAIVFTAGAGPRSGVVVGKTSVVTQVLDEEGRPLSGLSVQGDGVGMGHRSARVGNDVGSDALLDVLGQSLQPNPLLTRPGQNP